MSVKTLSSSACPELFGDREFGNNNQASRASHLSFQATFCYDGIMPVSDEFLEYVIDQLSAWGEVRAKRMFGGVGLYHSGTMFGLIADDVLYLKVGDANRPDFEAIGARPFQPYPGKKTSMPYNEIPEDVLEDQEKLEHWAEKALAVAQQKKK